MFVFMKVNKMKENWNKEFYRCCTVVGKILKRKMYFLQLIHIIFYQPVFILLFVT